ncbi:LemA family protein [Candidatus Saccharibacteria bacterium]|nr:LemA family protein [Candidatus Saccharibacteria bacterium]
MHIGIWIAIGVVVLILLVLWVTYNGLVRLNERVNEAWSDITVQLKFRADLIPNVIESVKGYAAHEKGVFEEVTKARSGMMGAGNDVKAAAAAQGEMTQAMGRLFAVAEGYPQLRASENFVDLQNKLQDSENKLQAARRFYNAGVRDLNVKIKVFPSNVFAKKLGFTEKEFFEVEDRAKLEEAPKVKF